MRERTVELKKQIRRLKTTQEKLDVLRGAFAGEKCYLVTCGPSINSIWNERVRQILADNLVIAVKQAYDLSPEVMDFHLLNPYNYQKYQYPEQKPITLMIRTSRLLPTPGLTADLSFTIPPELNVPEKILARARNFDDYLFTKTLDRPWGQGIVYELGIYLAVHLGVSELIMVGWDIGEAKSSVNRHYYEASMPQGKTSSGEQETRTTVNSLLKLYLLLKKRSINLKFLSKFVPRDVQHRLLWQSNTRRYYDPGNKKTVTVYNAVGPSEGEAELIADSTRELYYWLKQKGIDLKIVSDRSVADPCIPRIEL